MSSREALFISHAPPADNAFARWLGAKLTAMGFEVWADILELHGGADWSRDLEDALRNRAVKMLLVCTPAGLERQGVRNEIEIASELSRELADREFIIPLRLEPYKPPFRIAQSQYVDFSYSWAAGFAELVDLLVNICKIPRNHNQSVEAWLVAQGEGSSTLVRRSEPVISNWLEFKELPSHIYYQDKPAGVSLENFQDKALYAWPVVPFHSGILTFAYPGQGLLEPEVSVGQVEGLRLDAFLAEGWGDPLGISAYEARRLFSDLANQALDRFSQSRGLVSYDASNGRLFWWGRVGAVPLAQIPFLWSGLRGRRQIIGLSEKRGVHWHYAVNLQARTSPVYHVRIAARLIFSENGLDAVKDVRRMHRLRRSFAKSWRNARWRDMQLAFLAWLGNGCSAIEVPVSSSSSIVLALPPMVFNAPVSVAHFGEEAPDEDDPDIEFDLDEPDGDAEVDGGALYE